MIYVYMQSLLITTRSGERATSILIILLWLISIWNNADIYETIPNYEPKLGCFLGDQIDVYIIKWKSKQHKTTTYHSLHELAFQYLSWPTSILWREERGMQLYIKISTSKYNSQIISNIDQQVIKKKQKLLHVLHFTQKLNVFVYYMTF